MDYTQKLGDFFTPDLLRQKLITASVFIAVYENFKSAIVDNVKYFYCNGVNEGEEQFKGYDEAVLSKVDSKKNRQIRATLLWYNEHGAISEQDIKQFKKMTDLRNALGHDMLNKIFDGLPENILDVYFEMIELFTKITRWWINEIEIPISGNFTLDEYNTIACDDVTSVNLEFIKIMTDVAFTGNEKYLESLHQEK
ncbi:MAG: hypothetical protein RR501_08985 [Cloacibacillus sp.]